MVGKCIGVVKILMLLCIIGWVGLNFGIYYLRPSMWSSFNEGQWRIFGVTALVFIIGGGPVLGSICEKKD